MAQSQKVASAYVELGVDDSKVASDMGRAKSSVNTQFADLAKAAAAGFAGFGIKQFADFGVKAAAQAEVAKIGFEVLTGSVDKAEKTIKELKKFADFTPFEDDQVTAAGKRLLSAGVDTEFLTEKLKFLGDASAAVGANFTEVVGIYSKIRNQGKLTGETFEQLAERSINLAPVIQEQLGISADKFKEMQAAGKITTEIVEDAFKKMNSEGGLFFGAMDKLSVSYEGRLSTLSSRFQDVARTIGNALLPAKKMLVEIALKVLDAYLAIDPAIQRVIGIMIGLAPAVLGVAAAFKIMQAAGIGAAVGIRAALAATGVGILLPLIGFVIAKFLDLVDTMSSDGMPMMDMFRGSIEKLQIAWEHTWDAINEIFTQVTGFLRETFGSLLESWGIDIDNWQEGFFGMVAGLLDAFANFVLNIAEWFNVIVHNWSTVLEAIKLAWQTSWSFLGDILSNFIGAAWTSLKGFAESIVDVFTSIPAAIRAIFSGEGVAAAIDELFSSALTKFAASQQQAFKELVTPSEETKQLNSQLQETLGQLAQKKRELEAEREKQAEETEKLAAEAEEQKKKEEPAKGGGKKEAKIKAGDIGLAEFAGEVQKLFLEGTGEDKQDKIIGINEEQAALQAKMLETNEKMLSEMKSAPAIRVATP